MLINGAHVIVYSTSPDADRAFLRDVLGFSHIDVGDGWLIFSLPPAELAVHPSGDNDIHELYLMCDDVEAVVTALREQGFRSKPIQHLGWGTSTAVTLPGGGELGIYQPRHARPESVQAPAKRARAGTSTRPRKK